MKELDLGFGRIALPDSVTARIVRTPDGGAVIGFLHDVSGDIGRVFLVPRSSGLQVDADMAASVSPDDAAWKRSLMEPIAHAISEAIDRALASRRQVTSHQ